MRKHISPTPVRLLLASVLALATGCAPMFMSHAEEELSGAITASGQCVVSSPRGRLGADSLRTEVSYSIPEGWNYAPNTYAMHSIGCAVYGPAGDTRYPTAIGGISILISIPKGTRLPLGTYRIVSHGGMDYEIRTAEVFVHHPGYYLGTPGAGHGGDGGQITLEGISGELELLRIDAPDVREGRYDPHAKAEVEARFHMRARRAWSMR